MSNDASTIVAQIENKVARNRTDEVSTIYIDYDLGGRLLRRVKSLLRAKGYAVSEEYQMEDHILYIRRTSESLTRRLSFSAVRLTLLKLWARTGQSMRGYISGENTDHWNVFFDVLGLTYQGQVRKNPYDLLSIGSQVSCNFVRNDSAGNIFLTAL